MQHKKYIEVLNIENRLIKPLITEQNVFHGIFV